MAESARVATPRHTLLRPRRGRVAGVALMLVAVGLGVELLVVPAAEDLCREPLDVRPRVEALARQAPPASVAAAEQAGGPAALVGSLKGRGAMLAAGALLVLKGQDWLAEPAHATLAAGLERSGCAPGAVGLQWLKAGSHARDDAEVERALAGLERQATRAGGRNTLAAQLAPYTSRASDPRALCVLGRLADPAGVPEPCRRASWSSD